MARRQPRWPEHGVLLAELVEAGAQRGRLDAQRRRQFVDLLVVVRQELMKRRIEQTDGDRQAPHDFEDIDEVLPLHGQDLGERRAPARFRRTPRSSRAPP